MKSGALIAGWDKQPEAIRELREGRFRGMLATRYLAMQGCGFGPIRRMARALAGAVSRETGFHM